jgi:KUP system potassium uptake protein
MLILVSLFWMQSRGTAGISRLFGPVMLVWFVVIAALGLQHIIKAPAILAAFSPLPGFSYLFTHGEKAVPVLGAVFLAITGAEALYADMGHFGRRPIRLAWVSIVLPALALSYLGQGALVLTNPAMASDPFFFMAPSWGLPFLVGLATLATIIASQAVITGAFSFVHQAVQLGLLPRLEVLHTSETQQGQIYLPRVNFLLMCCVMILVMGFGSSSSLATAYGIAVTGEMIITTILAAIVFKTLWKWGIVRLVVIILPIAALEVALLGANLTKFSDGGYLPISVATVLAICMWTWVAGARSVQQKSNESSVALEVLIDSLEKSKRLAHTQGTAVFLTAEPVVAPPALLHNLKHNGVLHAKNYVVSVRTANRPHIDPDEMVKVEVLSDQFARVRMTFGYMDTPNVPKALRLAVKFDIMTTSFFLNRRSYRIGTRGDLKRWQARLFVSMSKMATNTTDYFRLPSNRVVELGQQINL